MSEAPHFSAPEGEFAIDYRNNDGVVVLGDGPMTFRTKWSTRGTGSIYARRDAQTRIGVAPGVTTIEEVDPDVFSQTNFTSSDRAPAENEVLLIENDDGHAAAIQILQVIHTPESDPGSILKARYCILQAKGDRDFTRADRRGGGEYNGLQAAITVALEAYERLPDTNVRDEPVAGIGHNHPPEELSLTKEDYADIAAALREGLALRDEHGLRRVWGVVEAGVERLGGTLSEPLRLFGEGYFKRVGERAADLTIVAGAWMIFHGALVGVLGAIKAYGVATFGWPK